jgi:hypothetical protein
MKMLSVISEKIKGTILFNGEATGSAGVKGMQPKGSNGVVLQCLVTMANAANLALTVQTADDANGGGAVALSQDVPIFVNNVRQTTDGKTYTVEDDTGSFIVSFTVPSIIIPTGKFLCLSHGASNAANILSVVAQDDVYHETGKAA